MVVIILVSRFLKALEILDRFKEESFEGQRYRKFSTLDAY